MVSESEKINEKNQLAVSSAIFQNTKSQKEMPDSYTNAPGFFNGAPSNAKSSPTKTARSFVNNFAASFLKTFDPKSQLHGASPNQQVFSTASTVLVRDFPDTCAYPANAKGIPYCLMVPGKVTLSNGSQFTVNKDQIDSCVSGTTEVVRRLNMMEQDA